MTNELKNELQDVLEQDELDFLKSVLLQLQDNQTEIQDRLRRYKETERQMDLHLLLHELDRMNERTEITFNLAESLLNKVAKNTDIALQLLHNYKPESTDQHTSHLYSVKL